MLQQLLGEETDTELPHPLPSHLHLKDQYLALCFETWKSGREGGCCPCAVLSIEEHLRFYFYSFSSSLLSSVGVI